VIKFLDEFDIEEIKSTNVMLIRLDGDKLVKKAWIKQRGVRIEQRYEDILGNVRAREFYQYTYSNGGREISSYVRKLEWIDEAVIATEVTTPDLTLHHLSEVNKSARNGQIDYLEAAAANLKMLAQTLPEPLKTQYTQIANSIDAMMGNYDSHIRKYRERNTHTMDFENAVVNEASQTILQILGLPARQPDAIFPNGLTVKQSIMYQLTGVIP